MSNSIQDRIDRARAALDTYRTQPGVDEDTVGSNVGDLIADLLHLVEAEEEIDTPTGILFRAEVNFEAERDEN